MNSGLLCFHIARLRLNPRAPWPSEVAARKRYRMRRLRSIRVQRRMGTEPERRFDS